MATQKRAPVEWKIEKATQKTIDFTDECVSSKSPTIILYTYVEREREQHWAHAHTQTPVHTRREMVKKHAQGK